MIIEVNIEPSECYQLGVQAGFEQGIEAGEKLKAQEITCSLITRGLDAQTITLITGLSIEEIEYLAR